MDRKSNQKNKKTLKSSRADKIANELIVRLKDDPKFLEKFSQAPLEAMMESGIVLSQKEIDEILKKVVEQGLLPNIASKSAWWLCLPWWKDSF
jgi:hypothetical protein